MLNPFWGERPSWPSSPFHGGPLIMECQMNFSARRLLAVPALAVLLAITPALVLDPNRTQSVPIVGNLAADRADAAIPVLAVVVGRILFAGVGAIAMNQQLRQSISMLGSERVASELRRRGFRCPAPANSPFDLMKCRR